MSKVTEVTMSCSVRLNTGDYQGTEFFISHKHEVDEFDDAAEVSRFGQLEVEKAMMRQLVRAYRAMGKKVSKQVLAKHHGLTGEFGASGKTDKDKA